MRWTIALVGSLLAVFAVPALAQFAPGSFGDAVSQQLCQSGEDGNCSTKTEASKATTSPPNLSMLAPNSPETAAFSEKCKAGDAVQCHYFARVLDSFIRTYSERRTMYGCSKPTTRQSECVQLDALSKDVGVLIAPAGMGYAKACDASINVACIEGARLELGVAQPGAADRALNLLYAGCARDDIGSCRELNGLRKRVQVDAESARLAVGKLCVLAGEPVPCYEFGQALEFGIGGPANYPAARDAYERGCAEPGNHPELCWSYGKSLLSAFMGTVDKPKAREAFLKYCALKQTKRCVAAEEIKP